VTSIVS
jgi:hypothetical protein